MTILSFAKRTKKHWETLPIHDSGHRVPALIKIDWIVPKSMTSIVDLQNALIATGEYRLPAFANRFGNVIRK